MKRAADWSTRHARGLSRAFVLAKRWAGHAAPLVRAIGAARAERWLSSVEGPAKSALFDCRMCGQCVLSATGLSCPMRCAKQMRNGPCGGVRDDGGCEVRPGQRCVWIAAAEGDRRIHGGHVAGWRNRVEPLDHRLAGRSSWIRMLKRAPSTDPVPLPGPALPSARPAAGPDSASGPLEASCRRGRFAVTVEISPPDSADPAALVQRARRFDGLVDAINITDGAGANCHMSSVAAASVLAAAGFTPVCQVGCRDRNRIALQGDVLGAAALGVSNVLCLTGDDVSQGDHPQARPVFDLDAVNLLHVLRGMRDRGEYASGRRLEVPPRLFLGATANPFAPPFAERVDNLERKIDAGAQFIQTQFCFDLGRLEAFMREVVRRGVHRRAAILVGVGTLSTAKALRWMAGHVPGVVLPEALIARIAAAADQREEGKRIAIETIRALRDIEGVAGVHLMGHRNDSTLAEIIVQAGLRAQARAV